MKYRKIAFLQWGGFFFLFIVFLHNIYGYFFIYTEQFQLFSYTNTFFFSTVAEPGGFALYCSYFLLQFYSLPFAGSIITAFLLVATGLCLHLLLNKDGESYFNGVLSLIPCLLLLLLHVDIYYRIQGSIAILFAFILLLGYTKCSKSSVRILYGIIGLFVLFYIAGSVAIPYLVICLYYECAIKKNYIQCLFYLIPLSIFLVYFLFLNCYTENRFLFTPDMYYEPLMQTNKWSIIFWFVIVGVIFIHPFINNVFRKHGIIFSCIIFYAISSGVIALVFKNRDVNLLQLAEQDYYLRNNNWDEILRSRAIGNSSIRQMNLVNLALAKKGELGERLLDIPQKGWKTLFMEWDNTLQSSIILAEICYHIGDIASAQKFAFEGMVSSVRLNPRLMMLLVKTNLIFGEYVVAKKYLNTLSQTLFYRTWAKEYEKYADEKSLELQTELIQKRKALMGEGTYAVHASVLETLQQLSVNNPGYGISFQYLTAFHLLAKNLSAFGTLHTNLYPSECWQNLSKAEQEAIIALNQDNPKCWPQKGVTLKTEKQYGAFMQDISEKRNQIDYQAYMKDRYGDTYWYYLLFINIK